MRACVIGASGFLGRHLEAALRARGDEVVTTSLRDPRAAAAACSGCDVIVNLAGEPLAQRWTPAVKQRMMTSRIDAPRALIEALTSVEQRPGAYISASAVGYYGTSDTATFTETSPSGNDFLAQICVGWEREARKAAALGMRVAIVRNGVVLGSDGGALAKMLPPFRMGAGGVVGSGKQWFSWIHIDDAVGIFLTAIDGLNGVVNATAPVPVTNAELTSALGEALHRPAIIPVPTFALRMVLGEGADMLLTGQRVLPERTLAEGFRFKYETIGNALTSLV